MKTKRFAALALALTMAMGTFTGCSGNNSSSTADTGDTIRIGAIAPAHRRRIGLRHHRYQWPEAGCGRGQPMAAFWAVRW